MSSLNQTPKSNRFTIGLFGNRNAGKSSLINALTNQELAVVSEVAGTTTDPVDKAMEILPIGPVLLIDTPGLDDIGELGKLRIEKTYESLRKCNFAIFVTDVNKKLTEEELGFTRELAKRKIPCICAINKCDNGEENSKNAKEIAKLVKIPSVCVSAYKKLGIEKLKESLIVNSKDEEVEPSILEGLINKGDTIVLVTPIDSSAPKGRMILPQQQVIRAILDNDAICIVTKETDLTKTLNSLKNPPKMVITDSQAFNIVNKLTPKEIPLTSFSILFARQKGDLDELLEGIKHIENLTENDKVLIVEGCTHHRKEDDIGTVKIPKWLREKVGEGLTFEWTSGAYFPKDVSEYSLVVHCGACMINRKEMLFRIEESKRKQVAITNYGMLIAYVNGIIKRSMSIFK